MKNRNTQNKGINQGSINGDCKEFSNDLAGLFPAVAGEGNISGEDHIQPTVGRCVVEGLPVPHQEDGGASTGACDLVAMAALMPIRAA